MRNDIARELRPAQRVDHRRRAGEIARPLLLREHDVRSRAFTDGPLAFVGRQKERLVLADRAGEYAAELVPPQDVLGKWLGAEVAAGVEFVIAQEFPQAAMEPVGARAQLQIGIGAGIAAVLRRVVATLHLELLERIEHREQRNVVAPVVYQGDAIDVELHPAVARAVGDDAGTIRRGSVQRRLVNSHSRRQHGQLHETPAVQGKIDDALRGHHFSQSRILGLQQRRGGRDLHRLLNFADLQLEVNAGLLVDLDHNAGAASGAETWSLDLDSVLAGYQVADIVFAVGSGLDGARDARGLIADRHVRRGDRGSSRVRHRSNNTCIEGLGSQRQGPAHHPYRHEQILNSSLFLHNEFSKHGPNPVRENHRFRLICGPPTSGLPRGGAIAQQGVL